MHELGITQGIIDRARAVAGEAGAVGVRTLYVTVTPAADFTRESIEMYFEMLAGDDDFFRGAALVFEEGAATAVCLKCGETFAAAGARPLCARCGGSQLSYDRQAPMIQLTGVDVVEEGDTEGDGEDDAD
jgi:Zn finger protein HypA/HybF involved in hydrogenase expression